MVIALFAFPKDLSFSDDGEYKMVIVIRNDLKMGKGKIAAQVRKIYYYLSLFVWFFWLSVEPTLLCEKNI